MIRFSPSSLSTLKDCERCFWIQENKKIKRPRGIFPSLPGGMDRILKTYIDDNCLCLPPECAGIQGAKPYSNRAKVNEWRNWRKAPMVQIGDALISGAIDDLLEFDDGTCAPWDFKTRGAAPVPGDSEKYYGLQMDVYDLILGEGAGLPMRGQALLTYFWPGSAASGGAIKFNVETVTLKSDKDRAKDFVLRAASVIAGKVPPPAAECAYCKFVEDRIDFERDAKARDQVALPLA